MLRNNRSRAESITVLAISSRIQFSQCCACFANKEFPRFGCTSVDEEKKKREKKTLINYYNLNLNRDTFFSIRLQIDSFDLSQTPKIFEQKHRNPLNTVERNLVVSKI